MSAMHAQPQPTPQKVMDLGIIDSWLQGVAGLAPQGDDPGYGVMQEFNLHTARVIDGDAPKGFNRHTLNYAAFELISHGEIKSLAGFRNLLQACTRNDVRVDMTDNGQGRLEARFHPDEPFTQSRIFGSVCLATLPAFFRESE